jgi:putative Mg2+ transporter-C (MgtC) family protein
MILEIYSEGGKNAMTVELEDISKLLLALLIGGLVGAEREYRDKAAGFRTIIFICVGAALFTIFSLKIGGENNSARIAAQIVSGVGFLGAGVIMRDTGRITGMTTSATIWLVAALGMGVGGGYYLFSLFTTGIVLIVLFVFPPFEHWIECIRDLRTYEVVCALNLDLYVELEALFGDTHLKITDRHRTKADGEMICIWRAFGSRANHTHMMEKLFAHPDVRRFSA